MDVFILGKLVSHSEKIGWIGLGVMGEPMCHHLLTAGYELYVYTRTQSKADTIIELGATWCATPAEVARQADVIFTMVGLPDEVREVYFADQGIFAGVKNNSVLVDMGTTPPSLTLEIKQQADQNGCAVQTVDAPVSGGDVGARNGTLSVMVGGDRETVDRLQPVFDCMAKTVTYMGPVGHGQHTKLCNQLAVAGTMIGVCEALLYAKKSGVNPEELIQAIRPGAAGCWTLDNLAPRIVVDNFAPGFMVDHFIKDLGIALSECENMSLELPGLKLAHQLYQKTNQIGHGKSGTQALILALESLS